MNSLPLPQPINPLVMPLRSAVVPPSDADLVQPGGEASLSVSRFAALMDAVPGETASAGVATSPSGVPMPAPNVNGVAAALGSAGLPPAAPASAAHSLDATVSPGGLPSATPDHGPASELPVASVVLPAAASPASAARGSDVRAERFSLPVDAAGPLPSEHAATDERAPPVGLVERADENRADPAPWPPPGLESLFPEALLSAPTPLVASASEPVPPALPLLPEASASQARISPKAMPSTSSVTAAAISGQSAPMSGSPLGARGNEFEPLTERAPPGRGETSQPSASSASSHETRPIAAIAAQIVPKNGLLSEELRHDSEAVSELSAPGLGEAPPTSGQAPLGLARSMEMPPAIAAPVALATPRFADEIGARVRWQAETQIGEATIRISPDGLGPVEVRLRLDGERVDVGFLAPHTETRQALETALPRLREMLQQGGLQLGQSFIGGGSNGESARDQAAPKAGWPDRFANLPERAAASENPPIRRWQPRSLLDAYA